MLNLTKYVLRVAIFTLCLSAVGVAVSTGVGRFSTSNLYTALGLPTNQPPRFTYLIDPDRLLKLRVYPPFDPETIWTIQPRWDRPGQAYVWQRLRGDTFGDDSTVLYLQDILTGQVERLLDTRDNTLDVMVPVQESPFVSPNGRYFAFGRLATGDIYVLDREHDELHQVLNFSASSSSVQRSAVGYSSPRWSPDSQRIAYARSNALFLLSPNGDKPLEIKMAGNALTFGQWTDDSQTVLLSSLSVLGNGGSFPSRYDVGANHLDIIDEVNPSAMMLNWHCNGRWLSYLVPREIDSQTHLPRGRPPLFAGYIRDMESGEVMELDTLLGLPTMAMSGSKPVTDVSAIASLACGDAPIMLVYGVVSKEVTDAQSNPRPQPASQVLNLLHLTTKTVIPLTSAGWFQGWDEDTNTVIYATDEGNNLRKLYKRQMAEDSKAIEIGRYTYESQNIIAEFSSDYRYMLVIEGIPQINSDGRLKKIDLQTGQAVYLTGPDERVRSVTSIP